MGSANLFGAMGVKLFFNLCQAWVLSWHEIQELTMCLCLYVDAGDLIIHVNE